jgi:hypothetical protein
MARIRPQEFKAADKNCVYRKYVGPYWYTKDEIEFYVAKAVVQPTESFVSSFFQLIL